jgi:glycosyltransferase involved in cell wall biosynthesis
MKLSVVVPTLNGQERLAASLDALTDRAAEAEVVVVNGPSADGTTGMVRDRDDVDVLVELSDRNLNVARNAGIEAASGEAVALLRHGQLVSESWADTVVDSLADDDVVTGPTTERATTERRRVRGREVTYFDGGNVAFATPLLERLDGFDEYLHTGGARDFAHRVAGMDYDVAFDRGMRTRNSQVSDGGRTPASDRDWRWKYRSLAYRLVKNYGLRPTVVRRVASHAARDGWTAAAGVVRGTTKPTAFAGGGRDVVGGAATGFSDGLVARARDRSARRNPHGLSKRADRAVARYDWR